MEGERLLLAANGPLRFCSFRFCTIYDLESPGQLPARALGSFAVTSAGARLQSRTVPNAKGTDREQRQR